MFTKRFALTSVLFFFLDKVFSYLSRDEVERMKAEEEKKIATLTRSDIGSLGVLDDHSDDEYNEDILPQR